MTTLLICGGRNFVPCFEDWWLLENLHGILNVKQVVHGAARGADTFADMWAKSRGLTIHSFPVYKWQWEKFGKQAGYLRNVTMCEKLRIHRKYGEPVYFCAFPGGKGTRSMVQLCLNADIPGWFVHNYNMYTLNSNDTMAKYDNLASR